MNKNLQKFFFFSLILPLNNRWFTRAGGTISQSSRSSLTRWVFANFNAQVTRASSSHFKPSKVKLITQQKKMTSYRTEIEAEFFFQLFPCKFLDILRTCSVVCISREFDTCLEPVLIGAVVLPLVTVSDTLSHVAQLIYVAAQAPPWLIYKYLWEVARAH